jgi:Putative amidoligase enzyme
MKMLFRQFKFIVRSRRCTKDIWQKYYSRRKVAKKTDDDKFYMRNVREASRQWEQEVVVIHRPTKTQYTQLIVGPKINRRELMNKVLMKVKESRKLSRKMNPIVREFDGAHFNSIGGVFEKNGLINEIGKKTTINDPYSHKKPRHLKKNYIGVEVEFNQIAGVTQDMIAAVLKTAGLARYVNVTTDGSCGWEVRVLLPEDDYVEPLEKILKVIRDLGHKVDVRCGTHVHFDMRNRDVKLVYENLFKTQKFLRKFVTKNRKYNRFCQMNKAETFDKQLSLGDRYYSLNVQAYSRHKTIEVRMHQGTLDPSEIVPWIKLLLKIVNYQASVPDKVNTLKQARKQFDFDVDLSKKLEQRIITLFHNPLAVGG